jgi:hypothetical protein
LGGFGGEGKESKMCWYNFNYLDIIILIFILKCRNYPFKNIKLNHTEFFVSCLLLFLRS